MQYSATFPAKTCGSKPSTLWSQLANPRPSDLSLQGDGARSAMSWELKVFAPDSELICFFPSPIQCITDIYMPAKLMNIAFFPIILSFNDLFLMEL